MENPTKLAKYSDIQPFVRKEAQDIVDKAVRDLQKKQEYSTKRVPQHIHNGIDSPFTLNLTQVFTGIVRADGSFYLNLPFPAGWTIDQPGPTGLYRVTHNLDSLLYTVQLTGFLTNPPFMSAQAIIGIVVGQSEDFFDAGFFNVAGAGLDTSFVFTLTLINNSTPGFPNYVNKSSVSA